MITQLTDVNSYVLGLNELSQMICLITGTKYICYTPFISEQYIQRIFITTAADQDKSVQQEYAQSYTTPFDGLTQNGATCN